MKGNHLWVFRLTVASGSARVRPRVGKQRKPHAWFLHMSDTGKQLLRLVRNGFESINVRMSQHFQVWRPCQRMRAVQGRGVQWKMWLITSVVGNPAKMQSWKTLPFFCQNVVFSQGPTKSACFGSSGTSFFYYLIYIIYIYMLYDCMCYCSYIHKRKGRKSRDEVSGRKLCILKHTEIPWEMVLTLSIHSMIT